MADSSPNKTPAPDWRFPVAIGLGIASGGAVSRGLETNLEASLGYWGAFAISVIAAGLVGGLVAGAVYWLIKPGGSVRS